MSNIGISAAQALGIYFRLVDLECVLLILGKVEKSFVKFYFVVPAWSTQRLGLNDVTSTNTHLCSAGVGGGQTAGSSGLSSDWGARMSTGFSDLKLSSVPMMAFTCSYSSVSSCLTWSQTEEGEHCISIASQSIQVKIQQWMCVEVSGKTTQGIEQSFKCSRRAIWLTDSSQWIINSKRVQQ